LNAQFCDKTLHKEPIKSEFILIQEKNPLNQRIISREFIVKNGCYMPEPVLWCMLIYIRTHIYLRNEWEIWKILFELVFLICHVTFATVR
jgi:hypothetical protein